MSDTIKKMIQTSLAELSNTRPIFHSEKDFQHEFASVIKNTLKKELHRDVGIRLERPFRKILNGDTYNCDILILDGKFSYPIELKYKTSKLFHQFGKFNEPFNLVNQGAVTAYRYKILVDLERIVTIVDSEKNSPIGFAITITNSPSYWTQIDNSFSLENGRVIEGTLCLPMDASTKTYGRSMKDIEIKGKYTVNWEKYSDLKVQNGDFRHNIFTVIKKDL